MGRAWILAALALASCRQPAHVDLTITFGCQPQTGAAKVPSDPTKMDLACADFVEFMAYEDNGGKPGNLLGTDCLAIAELGHPATMQDLMNASPPTRLLSGLPTDRSLIFRVRAIHSYDPSVGCNDDLAQKQPLKVFDGLSTPFAIDGSDHEVPIAIDQCGSCADIPPPPGTGANPCATVVGTTAVNYDQNKYPGGQTCCATPLASNGSCILPGVKCSDGSSAQLLPGACCAYCPQGTAPMPGSTTP